MSKAMLRGAAALLLIATALAGRGAAQNSSGRPTQDTTDNAASRGSEGVASLQDVAGGGGTKTPVPATGEQIYRQVCQACHLADAKGAIGGRVLPGLASNPRLASAAYPIVMIVRGRGAMPAFAGSLKPAQVAAVTGYIRTHFGNNYPQPVTEAEVNKLWALPGASDH